MDDDQRRLAQVLRTVKSVPVEVAERIGECVPGARCNQKYCPYCRYALGQERAGKIMEDLTALTAAEPIIILFGTLPLADINTNDLRWTFERFGPSFTHLMNRRDIPIIGRTVDYWATLNTKPTSTWQDSPHVHFVAAVAGQRYRKPDWWTLWKASTARHGLQARDTEPPRVEFADCPEASVRYTCGGDRKHLHQEMALALEDPHRWIDRIDQLAGIHKFKRKRHYRKPRRGASWR